MEVVHEVNLDAYKADHACDCSFFIVVKVSVDSTNFCAEWFERTFYFLNWVCGKVDNYGFLDDFEGAEGEEVEVDVWEGFGGSVD